MWLHNNLMEARVVVMNRTFSTIILGLTVFASLLGLLCVNVAQRTYPFAIAFVVTIIICSFAGMVAVGKNTRTASLVQNGFVVSSFVLFILAVMHWSHGDDGPGMIMVGGIGPMLLFATVLATISTVLALKNRTRVRLKVDKPISDLPQDMDVKIQPSGLATASLATSCLGIVIGPLGCLAGVAFGHLARQQIRRHPGLGGGKIALAGLIIGYCVFVIYVAILCAVWYANWWH